MWVQACVYTSDPFEEAETLTGEAHAELKKKKKKGKKD